MKKVLIISLVLVLCIGFLSGCKSQQNNNNPTGEPQDQINPSGSDDSNHLSTEFFKFDQTTGTLLGFNEMAGGVTDIVIPNEIDGHVVRNIAANAFDNKGINSVILPDTLEKIERYAFANNNLTEIVFPESLTVIETAAFVSNNIIKLNIPDGITEIDVLSFSENQIEELILPDTLTVVRRSAFRNNKLTEINFPSSLLVIESNAFQQNLLVNLEFNEGLERIDGYAFDSNKLKTIVIPSSVKKIGYPTPDATPVKYYERFTFAYNNLVSVTILASDIDMNSFLLTDNNNFINAYLAGGPGTYKGTQIGKWEKVD